MPGEPKNQKPFTNGRRTLAKKLSFVTRAISPKPKYATATSEQGLEFIARFEGCVLHPYNDPAGYATIGVGHLLHYSNITAADVAKYHGFTRADAIHLLKKDVARFEEAVRDLGVKLKQHEFDALVSFAFNCGPGSLYGGVMRELRAGDKVAAMNVLRQYNKAGGRVLSGLVRRRADEATLFLSGRYT